MTWAVSTLRTERFDAQIRTWIAGITLARLWRLLSAYIISLAAVQIAALALSLGKVVLTRPLAVIVLLCACGFGYLHWRWQVPDRCDRTSGSVPGRLVQPMVLLIAAQSAITYILLWLGAYVLPDRSFDGNAYHIPTINLWAIKGYVHWIQEPLKTVAVMNGYPKGVELVSYLMVTAFGNSHLLNTANLAFLPLGVLGIAYLAQVLGASPALALLAGAAFPLVPVNICQAPTTYVDSSYASSAIAFVATIVRVHKGLHQGLRLRRGDALVLGSAMGLAMAVKSPGAALAAIGLAVLLVAAAIEASHATGEARRKLILDMIALTVLAAAAGLLVAGYWYVRNYLIAGSPLYPVGLTLRGRTIFPGVAIEGVIAMKADTPQVMRAWPAALQIGFTWLQGLSSWPRSIGAVDSRLGGLGYLWILGCVPSVAYLLFRAIRHPAKGVNRDSLFVVLAIVLPAFLVTPLNWWARYTVWIYALGLPCFVVALEALLRSPSHSVAVKSWGLACVVLLSFEAALCLGATTGETWPVRKQMAVLARSVNLRWQEPPYYVYPEMRGTVFDQVITSNAPVALGPLNRTSVEKLRIMGVLSLPIGRELICLDQDPEHSAQRIAAGKVRYVVWDDSLPVPTALSELSTRMEHACGFWVLCLPQSS